MKIYTVTHWKQHLGVGILVFLMSFSTFSAKISKTCYTGTDGTGTAFAMNITQCSSCAASNPPCLSCCTTTTGPYTPTGASTSKKCSSCQQTAPANCPTYNLCQGVEVPKPGPDWIMKTYCQIVENDLTKSSINGSYQCKDGKKVPTAWTPPAGTTTTQCATPPCPPGNSEREVGVGCTTYLQSEVCTNTVQVEEVYNGNTYYTCHPGKKVYTYTCVPEESTSNSMTSTESGGLGATPSNSMELNQSPGLKPNVPHFPSRANPREHKFPGSPH